MTTGTPGEHYRQIIERGEADFDGAQAHVVQQFDRVHAQLIESSNHRPGLLERVIGRFSKDVRPDVQGLYIWGGVGRGKTWLMDLFFDNLPVTSKRRVHFHRYMRSVHESLRELSDVEAPLDLIGQRQAREARVLCFDEFVVEDIGDAMILSGLLRALFANGTTLIATSNSRPEDLYRDGLQRDRFKPAIQLINDHTHVIHMEDGLDYRLATLGRSEMFITPPGPAADASLMTSFESIASASIHRDGGIDILGRSVTFKCRADGIIWFQFAEICGGPRSSADYLEIAREYHTVLVSDIPTLDPTMDDAARRFIEMIDVFYDSSVNLIASATTDPDKLYVGRRLTRPFERTVSRLIEMQSSEYLGRYHRR